MLWGGEIMSKIVCNKKNNSTMKKILLSVAAIALLFAMGSCKKTCKCVSKIDGQVVSTTTMETKGKCSDLNVKQSTMGMTQETSCENE